MISRAARKRSASRQASGLAPTGFIEWLQTRRALFGLAIPLAPDFSAHNLHARPTFALPGVEVSISIGLLIAAAAWWRRRPKQPDPEREPEPEPFAQRPADVGTPRFEPPAAVRTRKLPPVMLLNLGPSAAISEIEAAPPLGAQDEVRYRIASSVGSIDASSDGRATVQGPDWTLGLNLGADDPVWTITADARGHAGIAALEKLARDTGWRIFMPKRGIFVEPAALKDLAS